MGVDLGCAVMDELIERYPMLVVITLFGLPVLAFLASAMILAALA